MKEQHGRKQPPSQKKGSHTATQITPLLLTTTLQQMALVWLQNRLILAMTAQVNYTLATKLFLHHLAYEWKFSIGNSQLCHGRAVVHQTRSKSPLKVPAWWICDAIAVFRRNKETKTSQHTENAHKCSLGEHKSFTRQAIWLKYKTHGKHQTATAEGTMLRHAHYCKHGVRATLAAVAPPSSSKAQCILLLMQKSATKKKKNWE